MWPEKERNWCVFLFCLVHMHRTHLQYSQIHTALTAVICSALRNGKRFVKLLYSAMHGIRNNSKGTHFKTFFFVLCCFFSAHEIFATFAVQRLKSKAKATANEAKQSGILLIVFYSSSLLKNSKSIECTIFQFSP